MTKVINNLNLIWNQAGYWSLCTNPVRSQTEKRPESGVLFRITRVRLFSSSTKVCFWNTVIRIIRRKLTQTNVSQQEWSEWWMCRKMLRARMQRKDWSGEHWKSLARDQT